MTKATMLRALALFSLFVATTVHAAVPLTDEQFVSPSSDAGQFDPAIATDGNAALGVWSESTASGDLRIAARRIDANGAGVGDVIEVSPLGSSPSVAYGAGRYLVIWRSGTTVYGRFVVDGSPSGSAFAIRGTTRTLAVTYDGGDFLVAVSASTGITLLRVGANASVTMIGTFVSGTRMDETRMVRGPGEVLVAYSGNNTDHNVSGVFAYSPMRGASTPVTLESFSAPCAIEQCDTVRLGDVAWNNREYGVALVNEHGIDRGVDVAMARIATGGAPIVGSLRTIVSGFGYGDARAILAPITENFLLLYRLPQPLRIRRVNDTDDTTVAENAAGAAAAAKVGTRIVLLYATGPTQRVASRTVPLPSARTRAVAH